MGILELSSDAIKYLIIVNKLVATIRMKSQDAKKSKLEYYNTNIKKLTHTSLLLRQHHGIISQI